MADDVDTGLSSVLGKISAADLHVDETGRVVVKNEKIASALKGALGQGVGARLSDSVNQSGCANTQCIAPPSLASNVARPGQ